MIKYFLDTPALPSIDLRFERKSSGASGYDLMANIGMQRTIAPGSRWFCNTGLYLDIPIGIEAQVRTRSGLSRDHGIVVLNSPGTVDSDYRGEICVTLYNTDRTIPYTVIPGDRIAQLVFAPIYIYDRSLQPHDRHTIVRVDTRDALSDTDRGDSGHGSTGR